MKFKIFTSLLCIFSLLYSTMVLADPQPMPPPPTATTISPEVLDAVYSTMTKLFPVDCSSMSSKICLAGTQSEQLRQIVRRLNLFQVTSMTKLTADHKQFYTNIFNLSQSISNISPTDASSNILLYQIKSYFILLALTLKYSVTLGEKISNAQTPETVPTQIQLNGDLLQYREDVIRSLIANAHASIVNYLGNILSADQYFVLVEGAYPGTDVTDAAAMKLPAITLKNDFKSLGNMINAIYYLPALSGEDALLQTPFSSFIQSPPKPDDVSWLNFITKNMSWQSTASVFAPIVAAIVTAGTTINYMSQTYGWENTAKPMLGFMCRIIAPDPTDPRYKRAANLCDAFLGREYYMGQLQPFKKPVATQITFNDETDLDLTTLTQAQKDFIVINEDDFMIAELADLLALRNSTFVIWNAGLPLPTIVLVTRQLESHDLN